MIRPNEKEVTKSFNRYNLVEIKANHINSFKEM